MAECNERFETRPTVPGATTDGSTPQTRRAAKSGGDAYVTVKLRAGTSQSSVELSRATACFYISLLYFAIHIVVWRYLNIQAFLWFNRCFISFLRFISEVR